MLCTLHCQLGEDWGHIIQRGYDFLIRTEKPNQFDSTVRDYHRAEHSDHFATAPLRVCHNFILDSDDGDDRNLIMKTRNADDRHYKSHQPKERKYSDLDLTPRLGDRHRDNTTGYELATVIPRNSATLTPTHVRSPYVLGAGKKLKALGHAWQWQQRFKGWEKQGLGSEQRKAETTPDLHQSYKDSKLQ